MNDVATAQREIDWQAFRNEIDGVSVIDDERTVKTRSGDYFWYKPDPR